MFIQYIFKYSLKYSHGLYPSYFFSVTKPTAGISDHVNNHASNPIFWKFKYIVAPNSNILVEVITMSNVNDCYGFCH